MLVDGDVAQVGVMRGGHPPREAARERVELHHDADAGVDGSPDDQHPDDRGIDVRLGVEAVERSGVTSLLIVLVNIAKKMVRKQDESRPPLHLPPSSGRARWAGVLPGNGSVGDPVAAGKERPGNVVPERKEAPVFLDFSQLVDSLVPEEGFEPSYPPRSGGF